MTTLLLFRHSIAESPQGKPDPGRHLTEEGVARARSVMAGVVSKGWIPALGLCSPYVRTRETLDLLQEALGAKGHPPCLVRTWPGCCPDSNPRAALSHLEHLEPPEHGDAGGTFQGPTVALVSHEPFAGDLVQAATGGQRRFQPCDLVILRWDGLRWQVEADLPHEAFRSSGPA